VELQRLLTEFASLLNVIVLIFLAWMRAELRVLDAKIEGLRRELELLRKEHDHLKRKALECSECSKSQRI